MRYTEPCKDSVEEVNTRQLWLAIITIDLVRTRGPRVTTKSRSLLRRVGHQTLVQRLRGPCSTTMADRRRAEIEEKKAKLAELRRARDERKVLLAQAEQGPVEVVLPSPSCFNTDTSVYSP